MGRIMYKAISCEKMFFLFYENKYGENKNANPPSKVSKSFCFNFNGRIDDNGCIENVFQECFRCNDSDDLILTVEIVLAVITAG